MLIQLNGVNRETFKGWMGSWRKQAVFQGVSGTVELRSSEDSGDLSLPSASAPDYGDSSAIH